MCPLVSQKVVLCVSFLHLWQGAGGSRSKNLLEGVMKQMLSQGRAHIASLLDEVREPGARSTPNQKTRTVSTCLMEPKGLALKLGARREPKFGKASHKF